MVLAASPQLGGSRGVRKSHTSVYSWGGAEPHESLPTRNRKDPLKMQQGPTKQRPAQDAGHNENVPHTSPSHSALTQGLSGYLGKRSCGLGGFRKGLGLGRKEKQAYPVSMPS